MYLNRTPLAALALALFALLAVPAAAVETKVLSDSTFAEFNEGESTGTELLSLGRLRIGPRAERLHLSGDAVAWRTAVDRVDGSVFFATGNQGKVYRRDPAGKVEQWAQLREVQAMSLAIDPTGGVLIGASPGGKIYRVTEAGKPQLFFETGEQYIWDLIFDRNSVLYAATGPNGKVFRIRSQNNGEVYYDSDATNIMALDFDSEGRLIAATQGRGSVIRIDGPHTAYILHSSREDEIRALAADKSGNIYAAVNSSRASGGMESAPPSPASGAPGGRSAAQAASASPSPTPAPSATPPPSRTPSREGGQSNIIQIQPSGFVTEFWQSPEGPIQSLLADPASDTIFVAAGQKGKLYRLTGDANFAVVADVDEPMIMSLGAGADGTVYFTTANKAALYQLASHAEPEGIFASRALNAGTTVRWGNIYYDAEEPDGTTVLFETRTGNTAEPNTRTWSEWTATTRIAPRIVKIESPIAQYLQYRVTLKAPNGTSSLLLDSVQSFYVAQNAPPIIKSITPEKVAATPATQTGAAARPAATPARTGTTSDSGSGSSSDSGTGSSTGSSQTSSQTATGRDGALASRGFGSSPGALSNSQKVRIAWDVTDPNGDSLLHKLFFKGEDETQWKLIEDNLTASNYVFTTEAIPDGKYRFKVESTDAPANPDTTASSATLVSRIYIVDNTPPVIREFKGRRLGPKRWEITAEAEDETSIISAAEYNLDAAKTWRVVNPEDGIFDLNREAFRFEITPEEDAPEHTLSLRVYDREGNSHVAKLLLR